MTDLRLPAVTPLDLRLHGAGDGSVMAYCRVCREPLPILPRPVTLDAVLTSWTEHAAAVHQTGEPEEVYRCRLPHREAPSPSCSVCRDHGHVSEARRG